MSSYYDIDDILCDSQKVAVTFEVAAPSLGYLQGNPGTDIKAGTKVDVPFWLGELLLIGNASVDLDLPECLSKKVLNALKADAKTVELRALAPHFFSLASRFLDSFPESDDIEDLVDLLSSTFQKRAGEIADQANNTRGSVRDGDSFLRGLDEDERQLFRKAHDSSKAVKIWMASPKS